MSYKQITKYNTTGKFASNSTSKNIIFLYEGCIILLKKAQEAIKNGLIQEKFDCINKVSKIIEGFRISLDFEKAPELPDILNIFYAQIYLRVIKVNFEVDKVKNIQECDKIIADLEAVLSSWKEVDHELDSNAEKSPSAFDNCTSLKTLICTSFTFLENYILYFLY